MWFRKVLSGLLLSLTISQSAFACRLEAMMGPRQPSPKIWQEENNFLQTTLIDDANSLQKESAKRPAKQGTQVTYDVEDLIGIREKGNMDGWGLVHYACGLPGSQLPQASKNAAAAYADAQYAQAVQKTLAQGSSILMAHIRRAADEYNQVELTNVHPFTCKNWSFMHNGVLTGAFSPTAKAKIEQYREQLGSPKGITDSEHVFYYFLANLQDATGTLESQKIPTSTVQTVFAQTIKTLLADSEPRSLPLNGNVLGVQGNIQVQPACNFVVSDGTRLLAFKLGRNLFLGQKTLSNGQHLYLVASEKTHTTDKTVHWLALPENHILTISWDASGNPVPEVQPLARLTP